MKTRAVSPLMLCVILTSLAGCGGIPVKDRPPVALPADLATRGESIYVGSTFSLDGGTEPLFTYERRVEGAGDHLVSTHITRTPGGVVALADQATHTDSYELRDYLLLTDQQGQTGSIHVEGHTVTFALGERGRVEQGQGDVVVGPTLVGYLWKRLDILRAGKTIAIRFAVLDRLETLDFTLSAVPAPSGETRVQMSPASLIIGLVVDPIFITFETATGMLARIEGRVPPKREIDGVLFDLDARVEYRFVAPTYR